MESLTRNDWTQPIIEDGWRYQGFFSAGFSTSSLCTGFIPPALLFEVRFFLFLLLHAWLLWTLVGHAILLIQPQ